MNKDEDVRIKSVTQHQGIHGSRGSIIETMQAKDSRHPEGQKVPPSPVDNACNHRRRGKQNGISHPAHNEKHGNQNKAKVIQNILSV